MAGQPGMVLPPVGRDGVDRQMAQLWDVRVPTPFGRWGEETTVQPVGYYDGRMAPSGGAMAPSPCNPDGKWASARHLFDALQSSEGDRYDGEDQLQPKAFQLVLTCVRCGVVRELRGHLDPDDAPIPGDRQVGQLSPAPLKAGHLLAQEVSRSHFWGDEWHVTWTVYADGLPVGWMRTDRGRRGKRYVSGALGHPSVDATVKGASAAAVLRKLATASAVVSA